jgi:hypothetical protein
MVYWTLEATAVVVTVRLNTKLVSVGIYYTDETQVRDPYEIDPRRVTFSFALSFALIYAVASALTSTR